VNFSWIHSRLVIVLFCVSNWEVVWRNRLRVHSSMMKLVVMGCVLIWLFLCLFTRLSEGIGSSSSFSYPHQQLNDPNVTIVQTAIENYALYLNYADCKSWVNLFAPNGIKYDPPSPSIGHAQLMAFCESTYTEFLSFTYTIAGPILVTKSDGYRAMAQWMLGGVDNTSTAYVQNGYGSFVFDENFLIATATGYNLFQSYAPNGTFNGRPIHRF